MTNGKRVCPVCGRKFSTPRSLQQHQAVVHKPAAKAPRVAGRRRRRGSGNAGNSLASDLAPSRIPTTRGGTISVGGEDRLSSFDLKANKPVFVSVDISPSMSSRLSTMSRAYQRIRYQAVEVIVTPQASAMTNGGYVCGFILDPSDRAITARDLSASQGSQTKKFYESAVVKMPRKPDLLYTSVGDDPRLTIPATFWVVSEGKPSSDLTLILTVRWSVVMSCPTLEDHSQASFTLNGEIVPKQSNYNLQYVPPGGTATDDCSSIIPPSVREIPGDHVFRVPTFLIEYSEGTGDTGTIQAHFIHYRTTDKRLYYSSDGRNISTTSWQGNVEANQVLVPCGTFCKYVGPENLCKTTTVSTPLLSSGKSMVLGTSLAVFNERLRIMEKLFRELPISLRNVSIPSSSSSMENLDFPES